MVQLAIMAYCVCTCVYVTLSTIPEKRVVEIQRVNVPTICGTGIGAGARCVCPHGALPLMALDCQ